jgi:putative nucleotidyltransferase with HDIG domain
LALDVARIDPPNQEALRAFLGVLRAKEAKADEGSWVSPTYEHCIRVGLLACAIGKFMGVDERALLFAGLLHDIGKALVLMSTLGKTKDWTEEDNREMEGHVTDGFRLLRGRFDFSAQVVSWHHQFQGNYYPKELPKPLHEYSKGTEVTIAMYGRILALADSFDALHRVNFQDGKVRARTDEEIKTLMLERNPDQAVLVGRLYEAGVLL